MASPTLHARELSLFYRDGEGRRSAVDRFSADFSTGQMVMIMGPSGSGKTSLVSLLGLMRRPDRGEVAFGETSLGGLRGDALSAWRRDNIGFVFQQGRLFDQLSVLDNVALPLALQGLCAAERECRSLAALARLGLEDRVGARPRALSGGEQQRVSLVRAVVHDPAIVIADEPTAALDKDRGMQVGEWFRQIARDGRIVIVTSHDERLIGFADRLIHLEDGRMENGQMEDDQMEDVRVRCTT